MKFTVPKLIFLLATIAIIAIILSGCNIDDVLGYLSTVRVDEYDMEVNYYNEGATYLFSGKVVLTKYDEEDKAKDSWLEDELGLRLNTGQVGDVKPILSGDFDEVGYASKQIFIKRTICITSLTLTATPYQKIYTLSPTIIMTILCFRMK